MNFKEFKDQIDGFYIKWSKEIDKSQRHEIYRTVQILAKEFSNQNKRVRIEKVGSNVSWSARRREILERDKNKCQVCGGKAQEVHHIIAVCQNNDKADNSDRNLISLCKKCHRVVAGVARVNVGLRPYVGFPGESEEENKHRFDVLMKYRMVLRSAKFHYPGYFAIHESKLGSPVLFIMPKKFQLNSE